jgi:DNA-directed RNA polymerase subunit F
MSTLRQRILDNMDTIARLIASEKRALGMEDNGDFRPRAVRYIVQIERLEPTRAHHVADDLKAVSALADRLKKAVMTLPPSQRLNLDVAVLSP